MPVQWLETREIPLGELTRFPGNARRGNVAEIRKSIRATGQYRAIVVRHAGDGQLVILAGKHTYDAVGAEGHATVRCELITCTDLEARKINLADNRLSDIALEDSDALVELLCYLDGDYDGVGWTAEAVDRLIEPPVPDSTDPEPGEERYPDQFVVVVTCSTEDEQATILADLQGQGYNAKAVTA